MFPATIKPRFALLHLHPDHEKLAKVANDPQVAACMALERDIEAREVLGVPRVYCLYVFCYVFEQIAACRYGDSPGIGYKELVSLGVELDDGSVSWFVVCYSKHISK